MPEIVFDTCVLSNFALSDSLPLLKTLYPQSALTTDLVALENLRRIQSGHAALAAVRQALAEGWLHEVSCTGREEKRLLENLSVSLGAGEASCIAIARSRSYVFACDDRAARKEATLCGVRLTGTIGILIKAVRQGTVELKQANAILRKMVERGFYAPVARITREMLE
jgi:predicted nucleic acid-binding protein